MTLIEHIKLIEYYATQALIHIQAQKYYKVYFDLDEIKTHIDKAQKFIKNNYSDTTEIPASLELMDNQSQG